MRRRRITSILGAALLAGTPSSASHRAAALEALRALDERVATVSHRLATANGALCRQRQWHTGLLIHDRSQYPAAQRELLASAFGMDSEPAVLAVVDNGPADEAGVRRDDAILAADGVALPRTASEIERSFAPTERALAALEAAFADGAAELVLRRGGRTRTARVVAEAGCASRFQVIPAGHRAAHADGIYVQLTSELIEFTRDDDELAALVAHELAHNMLRHRARLNDAGVDRGADEGLGRSGRLFRQTEMEADRLAVHLMARAGFDPQAAVRLWTRQSRDSRFQSGTHPQWHERIRAMEGEIATITAAQARGALPPPPVYDGPLDPKEN